MSYISGTNCASPQTQQKAEKVMRDTVIPIFQWKAWSYGLTILKSQELLVLPVYDLFISMLISICASMLRIYGATVHSH